MRETLENGHWCDTKCSCLRSLVLSPARARAGMIIIRWHGKLTWLQRAITRASASYTHIWTILGPDCRFNFCSLSLTGDSTGDVLRVPLQRTDCRLTSKAAKSHCALLDKEKKEVCKLYGQWRCKVSGWQKVRLCESTKIFTLDGKPLRVAAFCLFRTTLKAHT